MELFDKITNEGIDDLENEAYWRNYLGGFDTKTSLPTDRKKQISQAQIIQKNVLLSPDLTKKILDKSSGSIRIETILFCAWGILLKVYNNTNDVLFGTEYSNVEGNKNEDEFLNKSSLIKPLRIIFNSEESIADLITRLNKMILDREKYDEISFDEIYRYSDLCNDDKPFGSVVSIDYKGDGVKLNGSGCISDNMDSGVRLEISVSELISLCITYNEALFDTNLMERAIVHFENIIWEIVNNQSKKVSMIEILSDREKNQIILEFNDTEISYPNHKLINELFEEQVKMTPDVLAVIFEEQEITYGELNRKSNQLAKVLREKGVKPESIVGIMLERSINMIIGVIAVIKAGGAYLPIDPNYPEDRIKYMFEDSNAKVLVTHKKLFDKADFEGVKIAIEDDENFETEDENLEIVCEPKNLAYVIYTSGSTGKPKGVMVEHRQLVNLMNWMQNEFSLKQNEISVHRTSLTFDPSVWEIFWPLCVGATIKLLNKEQGMDARYLYSLMINNDRIKMIFMPSSLVKAIALILTESNNKKKISLPFFHFGAEPITMDVLKSIYPYLEGRIIDTYGPTECTIFNTFYYIDRDDPRNIVPIGKPIANNKIYILSKDLQLMPLQIAGEICISGDNVSRGYINNPEKTDEKFIDNPFGKGKLYRTGDIGRWLEDGNIEILGRLDHQVKIRGYRIELGEIEEALIRCDYIKDCVVLVKGSEINKYLCAYIVAGEDFDLANLKKHLSSELPNYMVPTSFVVLDKIPLTSNGKIDRRALPEPEATTDQSADDLNPQDEFTKKIFEIVSESINISTSFTIEDELQSLGINSINFVKIIVNIEKEFGIEFDEDYLNVERFKTVDDFVAFIKNKMSV